MSILLKILGVIVGIIVLIAGFLGITDIHSESDDWMPEISEIFPSDESSFYDSYHSSTEELPHNIWEALGPEYETFAEAYKNSDARIESVTYIADADAGMIFEIQQPDLIDALFNALDHLAITGMDETVGADYYETIFFDLDDGSSFSITFNYEHLTAGDHTYTVDDYTDVLLSLTDIMTAGAFRDDSVEPPFIEEDYRDDTYDNVFAYHDSADEESSEPSSEEEPLQTPEDPQGGFVINH